LPVPVLQRARGDVVDDGVAEDVRIGSASAMPRPPLPITTAISPS